MKTGWFMDGKVPALAYDAGSGRQALGADGAFRYEEGAHVTFYIGDAPIGTALGKTNVTPLDFYMQATREIPQYSDFCVLNTGRILLAAAEKGASAVELLGRRWSELTLLEEPEDFAAQKAVQSFLQESGAVLPSCAATRNFLRRCERGIHAERNVTIPLKDGRHLNAALYRPIEAGQYPVVMCMGAFGTGFINGFPAADTAELFEEAEDRFFSESNRLETQRMLKGVFIKRMLPCVLGSLPLPDRKSGKAPKAMSAQQLGMVEKVAGKLVTGKLIQGKRPALPVSLPKMTPASASFETPSPEFWVPHGYAVLHVEEWGLDDNAGDFKSFGSQNAHDYCEAIEWAAAQPWSSGKVGLLGASYYAMTQYTVAQYHPRGLAAMIPIMGDADSYRDYNYSGGGLYNRAENFDTSHPKQSYSNLDYAVDHPYLTEQDYGAEAPFCASADMSRVDYPLWGCLEPMTTLHSRGTSEAYIHSPSQHKKLSVVMSQGVHFWMYDKATMEGFRRFFDHWLKGEDNGVMDEMPVTLQIATGNGSYAVRREADWPVPETEYRRFYLAADHRLTLSPEEEGRDSYTADVPYGKWASSGVTYTSDPLPEELDIAGNAMADLFASSNTSDMELHIAVSVLTPEGREIAYQSPAHIDPRPVITGAAKASHRALDEQLTRVDSPFFRHTEEAVQKLTPDEVVECPVATFPAAFRIPRGSRLRLRIYPVDPVFVAYDSHTYLPNAVNTLHYGAAHPSYLQLPVLPKKA